MISVASQRGHTGHVELWQELVRRIATQQPVPQPMVVAALALVALSAILFAWPLTRLFVTVTHEAGHAVVATLTGRQLTGIRVHSDTSGLTVSRGKRSGAGMVLTLVAGYLAPGLIGLGAAAMLASGRAVALLWALVVVFALMVVKIRNLYGLLVMLVLVAVLGAASWSLTAEQLSILGYLITWLLLFAAPRPVLELAMKMSRTSDAGQLARITGVPAAWWVAFFGVGTLACLAQGTLLLAPRFLG